MSAPRKTAGSAYFQRSLDEALPGRRKPDGWIGDEAHKLHASSHNADDTPGSKPEWNGDPDSDPETRALDIRTPLTAEVSGQALVDHLRALPRISTVDHLRALPRISTVIRYLIHDGWIYHVRAGFRPERYSGDPHTGHVHITFAFTQAADNNTTFDYRLGDLVAALPLEDDKITITKDTAREIGKKAGDEVSAAILLQLAVIYAARADDKAAGNAAAIATLQNDMGKLAGTVEALAAVRTDPASLDARRALAAALTAQINAALGV